MLHGTLFLYLIKKHLGVIFAGFSNISYFKTVKEHNHS
jgi:hypothetical protein